MRRKWAWKFERLWTDSDGNMRWKSSWAIWERRWNRKFSFLHRTIPNSQTLDTQKYQWSNLSSNSEQLITLRSEHFSLYFQAYSLLSTQAMQSPELRNLDLVQELFDNYGAKQTNKRPQTSWNVLYLFLWQSWIEITQLHMLSVFDVWYGVQCVCWRGAHVFKFWSFFSLWNMVSLELKLPCTLLCSPGWPLTYDLPASASSVLAWQNFTVLAHSPAPVIWSPNCAPQIICLL